MGEDKGQRTMTGIPRVKMQGFKNPGASMNMVKKLHTVVVPAIASGNRGFTPMKNSKGGYERRLTT